MRSHLSLGCDVWVVRFKFIPLCDRNLFSIVVGFLPVANATYISPERAESFESANPAGSGSDVTLFSIFTL